MPACAGALVEVEIATVPPITAKARARAMRKVFIEGSTGQAHNNWSFYRTAQV
jgi:hypothetical protein